MSVFIAYAADRLGMSEAAIGWALSASGIGMIMGSLVMPRLLRRLNYGAIVYFGPTCGLAAMTLIWASLFVPSPWLVVIGMSLLGFGPIMWTVSTTSIRQHVTPSAVLSRVSGFTVAATAGSRPVGALLGFAGYRFGGFEWCLSIALLGFVIQAGLIWTSGVRHVRSLDGFEQAHPEIVLSYGKYRSGQRKYS